MVSTHGDDMCFRYGVFARFTVTEWPPFSVRILCWQVAVTDAADSKPLYVVIDNKYPRVRKIIRRYIATNWPKLIPKIPKPVAYLSVKLTGAQIQYSTPGAELLAIVVPSGSGDTTWPIRDGPSRSSRII